LVGLQTLDQSNIQSLPRNLCRSRIARGTRLVLVHPLPKIAQLEIVLDATSATDTLITLSRCAIPATHSCDAFTGTLGHGLIRSGLDFHSVRYAAHVLDGYAAGADGHEGKNRIFNPLLPYLFD
jgi:hypothetical protein